MLRKTQDLIVFTKTTGRVLETYGTYGKHMEAYGNLMKNKLTYKFGQTHKTHCNTFYITFDYPQLVASIGGLWR